MKNQIEKFAAKFQEDQHARLLADGMNSEIVRHHYEVRVVPGRKYTKVDVGTSGRFMIDQEGHIFGIKGYGKINIGHRYGTLDTIDQYYWGEYYPIKKATS